MMINSLALATNICEKKRLGWHFYCNKKIQDDEFEGDPFQARADLSALQESLEHMKATAVMYPTKDNIRRYLALQKAVFERADHFSKVWQQVVWQNPELDYSVKRPNSVVGNELVNEIETENKRKILLNLGNRYGFFFFYRSDCIYCRKFSPILKTFSRLNNIEILPVSLDGNFLQEWPGSVMDNGRSISMGLQGKSVPALILFDSKKQKIMPVGYGLLTIDELENRIVILVSKNESEE